LLQARAQLIHFIAHLTNKGISVRGYAVVAAVDFLQQTERLLSKHDADEKFDGSSKRQSF
jgi:hypothetical protein